MSVKHICRPDALNKLFKTVISPVRQIAHISKGEGIFFYAVDPNYSNNSTLMYLRSEGVSDEEASRAINELTSKIRNDHPEVSFIQREEYSREFKDSLSFMVFILYFIVALVSLVIAITINAVSSLHEERAPIDPLRPLQGRLNIGLIL